MAARYPHIVLTALAAAVLGLAAGPSVAQSPPPPPPPPNIAYVPPPPPPNMAYVQPTQTVYVPIGLARAVDAWDNSARRVIVSMEKKGVLPTVENPVGPGRSPFPGPYYFYIQQPGSTFLEQVRNTMEYELLKRGLAVARSPNGATVININLDSIHWGSLSSRQEVVWRATIYGGDRVQMKSTDILEVAAADSALYAGSTTLAPLASPGVMRLGAALPLRYAR